MIFFFKLNYSSSYENMKMCHVKSLDNLLNNHILSKESVDFIIDLKYKLCPPLLPIPRG